MSGGRGGRVLRITRLKRKHAQIRKGIGAQKLGGGPVPLELDGNKRIGGFI